jgi:nucleotidyltransferase substrate binding protein (TIGR01987 family)
MDDASLVVRPSEDRPSFYDFNGSVLRHRCRKPVVRVYEISHKLLRRYLAANPGPPELISSLNFADIIRLGNEQGLLPGDWRRWKTFRDMRARTSHSYDEAVALEVIAGIPAFLDEARALRDRLQARLKP